MFEEKTLKSAPQKLFTALRVEKHRVGLLQSRIVKMFPNVSVIDLSATIQVSARMMKQLSTIIKGFCILSMAAEVLILIIGVGMVSTITILEKKPVIYLREQPDE